MTDLIVKTMTWESAGVLSIVLVDPDGGPLLPWEPGAHIDVQTPAGHGNTPCAGIRPTGTGTGSAFCTKRFRAADRIGCTATCDPVSG